MLLGLWLRPCPLERSPVQLGRSFMVVGRVNLMQQRLEIPAMNLRGLRLQVEHRPNLKAWVREDEADSIVPQTLPYIRDPLEAVTVEDRPNLIHMLDTPWTSSDVGHFGFGALKDGLGDSHRRLHLDSKIQPIKPSMQVLQPTRLRLLPLAEHPQRATRLQSRRRALGLGRCRRRPATVPPWPPHQSSPSWSARRKSPNRGTPPYRPSR